MMRHYNTSAMSLALVILSAILLFAASGSPTSAQESSEPDTKFTMTAVDTEGGYFDLTLSPGDVHQIEINVNNSGGVAGAALLHVADVSTRVNGGIASALAGEPLTGPSLWIDFTEETLELESGASSTRTFTISIPDNAAPGEHLTSFVIQAAGDGTDTDTESGVMLKTVSRQSLPMLITIPGPTTHALDISVPSHTTAAGTSVINFNASNTGNALLKTTGEFTVADDSGNELFRSPVAYSSVYAHNQTTLEAPVDFLLEPGDYTVSMWLEDEKRGFRTESGPLPLNIPVPPAADPANPASSDPASGTETESATAPVIETQIVGVPTWVLLVAIPATLILGIVIAFFALKRRMQPAIAATTSGPVPQVVVRENPPATVASKPVPMRQMMPPSRNNDSTDTEK